MNKLLIFTAGSSALEVLKLISEINQDKKKWTVIGFVDPKSKLSKYKIFKKPPIIKNCYAICPILDGKKRKIIYESEINKKYKIPNLIHPNINIPSDLVKGVGNIFISSSHLSYEIKIGNFNLFSYNNDLGHNLICGDYNSFMPGVIVGGKVKIGNLNNFSSNSIILPKVYVGNNNFIGASSLISSNIKNNTKILTYPRQVRTKFL